MLIQVYSRQDTDALHLLLFALRFRSEEALAYCLCRYLSESQSIPWVTQQLGRVTSSNGSIDGAKVKGRASPPSFSRASSCCRRSSFSSAACSAMSGTTPLAGAGRRAPALPGRCLCRYLQRRCLQRPGKWLPLSLPAGVAFHSLGTDSSCRHRAMGRGSSKLIAMRARAAAAAAGAAAAVPAVSSGGPTGWQ